MSGAGLGIELRRAIEDRWQKRWIEVRCFEAADTPTGEAFYNFDGGPFPNGDLHMGHVRTFTLGDVMARYQRMRGKDVLYSFEFDAFGLPNELAAEKQGVAPDQLTRANIERMRTQMIALGYSYDWRYIHNTCDPKYYRWTQWLFLELFEHGLIYRGTAELNYCPSCATTLAHIQVIDGCCWRCEHPVELREMAQWFVRLSRDTALLDETLKSLSGWSDQIRRLLAGFMARTEGFEVDLRVLEAPGTTLTAFVRDRAVIARATRVEVAVGHHGLSRALADTPGAGAVQAYVERTRRQAVGRRRRDQQSREQGDDGVDTGLHACHPLTGQPLPVWVTRRVEMSFATGVELAGDANIGQKIGQNVSQDDGRKDVVRLATHYRVHDWLVSRQRRWGTPIPMVYCAECGPVAVSRDQLPVPLPPWQSDNTVPASCPCPRCGRPAERESDTLDCYFDVIWCFLACASRLDGDFSFSAHDFSRWMPVDWFHNGVDSVFYAHLYRFIGRVLYDLDILSDPEPIRCYHGHDAVLKDGKKMSKHHGNTVDPQQVIDRVGADVLRIHILWSASPLKKTEWSDAQIDKSERLLVSVWQLIVDHIDRLKPALAGAPWPQPLVEPGASLSRAQRKIARAVERAVQRITAFLDSYRMSGCLEELHRLRNTLASFAESHLNGDQPDSGDVALVAEGARTLVCLLGPFAPHTCEELWQRLGQGPSLLATSPWPAKSGQGTG